RHQLVPRRQDLLGALRPGQLRVPRHEVVHLLDLRRVVQLAEADHLLVTAPRERARLVVEHVGDAARHAGGEVAPGRPDDDDAAAGHVLAAVIADAFDDGAGAAVAHGEPFARDAAYIRFAGGRAVQR